MCGADPAGERLCESEQGSPPRVRSRPLRAFGHRQRRGITSACAEQTAGSSWAGWRSWDHLRVCGADDPGDDVSWSGEGSPPRVRSRPFGGLHDEFRDGITSACAEQTATLTAGVSEPRDHLRVCGADLHSMAHVGFSLGSPPRVRSRLTLYAADNQQIGITSACAEQTILTIRWTNWTWDHLRVCGADAHNIPSEARGEGSPPRVRSRLDSKRRGNVAQGITSACAEQTSQGRAPTPPAWDHLRVCGADDTGGDRPSIYVGSPPRVRSRRTGRIARNLMPGITSACAEQTSVRIAASRSRRDHLRVCGADLSAYPGMENESGSPPRVRSRRSGRGVQQDRAGITSACAEQTED